MKKNNVLVDSPNIALIIVAIREIKITMIPKIAENLFIYSIEASSSHSS